MATLGYISMKQSENLNTKSKVMKTIENTIFVIAILVCLLGCYTINFLPVRIWMLVATLPFVLAIISNGMKSKEKSN